MKVEYLWAAWGLPDPPPTGYPRPFLSVPPKMSRSELLQVGGRIYRNKTLVAVYVVEKGPSSEFDEYLGRVGQFVRLDHLDEQGTSNFSYSYCGKNWPHGWPVRAEKRLTPAEAPRLEDLCNASGTNLASRRGKMRSKGLVKLDPQLARALQAVFDGKS